MLDLHLWIGFLLPCIGFLFVGCVCCEECTYFTDLFDRADSTNIGSDWTEVVGDWSIVSNKLSIASANAVVKCNTAHPDASHTTLVTVIVRTTTAGNAVRILLNYQDSSNYSYAQFLISTTGNLKIFSRVGGVDTQLATVNLSTAINTDYTFVACMGPDLIKASIGDTLVSAGLTGTQSSWGLGHGSYAGGSTVFNDVTADKVGGACPTCPGATECSECGGGDSTPITVKVVTTGIDTNAASPNTCPHCGNWNGTWWLTLEATNPNYMTSGEPAADLICRSSYRINTLGATNYCHFWCGFGPNVHGYDTIFVGLKENEVYGMIRSTAFAGANQPSMRWESRGLGMACCSVNAQLVAIEDNQNCGGASDPTGANSPCKNDLSTFTVTAFC